MVPKHGAADAAVLSQEGLPSPRGWEGGGSDTAGMLSNNMW